MPEIGLRAPRLDRQPAAHAHEDDEQVCLEICPGDDGDRHEREDAEQEPVHVTPPLAAPIHIFEVFLGERPPDIDDQEDRKQKPTEQEPAVAGPEEFEGIPDGCHEQIIAGAFRLKKSQKGYTCLAF